MRLTPVAASFVLLVCCCSRQPVVLELPNTHRDGREHRAEDARELPEVKITDMVNATVSIIIHGDLGISASGTGVIVGVKNERLYILTARHVLSRVEPVISPPIIHVHIHDYFESLESYVEDEIAVLEASSAADDSALISCPKGSRDYYPAKIFNGGGVYAFEKVYTTQCHSRGTPILIGGEFQTFRDDLVVTTAGAVPGASGGGLFVGDEFGWSLFGIVVSIPVWGPENYQLISTVSNAMPMYRIVTWLEDSEFAWIVN